MTTALILVDLQNDFLPGGALAVADGDATVVAANARMSDYEIVVATQDWHPAGHLSFAANHDGKSEYEQIDLGGLPQTLWPVHCVQGTEGAAFAPGLQTSKITKVFQKGMDASVDSYSGFFDNGRRQSTGLGEWAREEGIEAFHVLGLATDYCVKFTALDARSLGFEVTLLAEGCRGVDLNEGDVAAAIEEMRRAGVVILE